jgi:hypothetical protein
VVEAARVGGKELRKESESISSEGLEGHWEKASQEMDRGNAIEQKFSF